MTESIEYLTDIIKNRSGETRKSIRDYPRHEISCNYIFSNHDDFSQAKAYAKATSPFEIVVPWWPYWSEINMVSGFSSTVYILNADEMYVPGDDVIITNGSTYVQKVVLTATATELTFTTTIGTSFVRAAVAPLIECRVKDGIEFIRDGGKINRASIKFSSSYVKSSAYQPWPLSGSVPIIDEPTKIKGSLGELIGKDIDIFDADTGSVTFSETEKYFRHNQTLQFIANGYTERRKIRRFLHWLKGRYNSFYLNTWADETESPASTLVRSDADRIEIKHGNCDSFTVNIPCAEVLA
jgi:hypothetical protein